MNDTVMLLLKCMSSPNDFRLQEGALVGLDDGRIHSLGVEEEQHHRRVPVVDEDVLERRFHCQRGHVFLFAFSGFEWSLWKHI